MSDLLRLGEVCTKIGSGATPRGGRDVYLADGPFTLIRSQNVYNGGFFHEGLAHIGEQHAHQLRSVEVQADDVLLNITGDSVARACQVQPDVLPARVNQHVAILRPDPDRLDARYLRYWLISPETQATLLSWARSGGTRNALTKAMIESLVIPAPPLAQQRRIARILGTLDEKIELNRRMNATLEGMARALFKSWFVDFEPVRAKIEGHWSRGETLPGMPAEMYDLFPESLVSSEFGDIPEGWEIKTVGDLCIKPQYGYTASAQTEPVGPHFLRITDINKKAWVDWGSVPFCEITDANYQKYRLNKGDILIARMAAPGHGVMIEEDQEAVFASYLIRFRLKTEWHQRFIQCWLRSANYWKLVSGRSAGTTRASLNAKVISGFPLIVPSDDIAKEFGYRIEDLRDRVVANTSESRTLSALRDVLLPSLVSGNLQVE